MNVLLDTHVLIWWLSDDRRLGKRARGVISNDQTSVWISAATIWEISIKASIDRLDFDPAFADRLMPEFTRSGFRALAVNFDHAFAVRTLPLHHRDPFDRILVAQAQCEGLTLLTADDTLGRYGIAVLDASA